MWYLLLINIVSLVLTQPANASKEVKVEKKQSAVIRKSKAFSSIEELLKNNKFNGDLGDLLFRIQNTHELLVGIVGSKNMNKEKIKQEIDKFNNNMKEIVERYNSLLKNNDKYSNKKKHKVLNSMPDGVKPIKGHSIVTLDCRKNQRLNRSLPDELILDNLFDPIQELKNPLTEDNVREFSENHYDINTILETKVIPDSDCYCQPISSSESALKSINDIEAQKDKE